MQTATGKKTDDVEIGSISFINNLHFRSFLSHKKTLFSTWTGAGVFVGEVLHRRFSTGGSPRVWTTVPQRRKTNQKHCLIHDFLQPIY